MKRLQYIWILALLTAGVCSCYEDDSLLADGEIVEVGVKTNVKDTINLYLGDNISITTQESERTENTTWQWSMGTWQMDPVSKKVTTTFKEIATTPDLEYKTTKLGHYYLRLVATNTYGSTIKYYHVFVNSEFEEGFLILGKKEDGRGSLAFMKTLTPEEVAQGLRPAFRQNLFAYTNGGQEMGMGPVDCDKVGSSLYILCREEQKLYQLNAKSFQLTFEFDFKRYGENFLPQDLMTYDSPYCRDLIVSSKNGGVAKVQVQDLEIFPYTELPQHIVFDRTYDRPGGSSSIRMAYISTATSTIYAYGFNTGNFSFGYFPCFDYFAGRKLIQVFFNAEEQLIVYSKHNDEHKLTILGKGISAFPNGLGIDVIKDNILSQNTSLLTENSVIIPNDPYSCLFFSNQNKVYKWAYNQSEIPSGEFIKLPEHEVVSCMSQSADQKQLYIGTYNSSRTGLKGSMYIYNTDTGKIVGLPYEGVADEPMKVMYKVK